MKIGDKLLTLRKYYDLTQGDLAKIAGVSVQAVSTWEMGTKGPKMEYVARICRHFGLDLNTFADEGQPFKVDGLRWDPDIAQAIREGVEKAVQARDGIKIGSPDEAEILEKYRKLNDKGKEYIRQTLDLVADNFKE